MPAEKPVLLAVFAHPDDETAVAPLLAHYAREGHPVYLASITSGQLGYKHANRPPGDELGRIREDELRCAARALGIHDPLLLGFQDQGISPKPVSSEVANRLREIIDRLRPEVVITFGPDGLTGHPDHRAAGNITTQVVQHRERLKHQPKKLYYVCWPVSVVENMRPPFNQPGVVVPVSDEYITTKVDCPDGLEAAWGAVQCHRTQWPEDRMDEIHQLNSHVLRGRVCLRLALTTLSGLRFPEDDIFAGVPELASAGR
jgi:LmbE family N-acetylglucosaminyl deacetylase